MIALHATVLVASLLGSLHCASMCGPFAAFAMMRDKRRGPWLLQVLYHGGRLLAYTSLGALAGGFGASLNLGGSLLGIGRIAGVFTGILLVVLGARRVLAILGVRTPQFPGGSTLGRGLGRMQAAIVHSDPLVRSLGTGLLTALLPCGWLYAFVAMAAGTGSALFGLTVMLAFWTGSVPILAGIGAGVRQALARSGRWLQMATAVLVIGLGVVSIVGRWSIVVPVAAAAPAGGHAVPEHPKCH